MSLRGWQAPLLVGTLLRVGAWAAGLWSGGWVQTDTPQYWGLATDGLAGYRASGGDLYNWGLMRPPGYPAVLAALRAIGDGYAGVSLLQVGFGVATLALTWTLARRIAGEAVAVPATWWLALSPIHVIDSSVLLTEVPFSAFLLAAILPLTPLVERRVPGPTRWAASGLTLGAATLIRPIALYMPIAVLAAMGFSGLRRRLVIPGLVFLAAFSVPVGAWLVRNHQTTGVAVVSTIQGINLAFYRAAGAIAVEEGISVDEAHTRMISYVVAERKPGMNPAELSRIETRLGIREILRHPVGYAYTVVRGLAITLVGPARSHFVERFHGTPAALLTGPLVVASALSAVLMTLASAVGALVWIRAREWRKLTLIAVPLVYLLLIGAGPESWARFRVPLEPLLVILAAVGVRALLGWVMGRRLAPG